MQLDRFEKFPCLSELVMKIRIHTTSAERATDELNEVVDGNKAWVDQCLAIIKKSGAPSPKSMKILYLVLDSDARQRWNGFSWKTSHTISVTV